MKIQLDFNNNVPHSQKYNQKVRKGPWLKINDRKDRRHHQNYISLNSQSINEISQLFKKIKSLWRVGFFFFVLSWWSFLAGSESFLSHLPCPPLGAVYRSDSSFIWEGGGEKGECWGHWEWNVAEIWILIGRQYSLSLPIKKEQQPRRADGQHFRAHKIKRGG